MLRGKDEWFIEMEIEWRSNISAISDFSPFKPDDRLMGKTPESLIEFLENNRKSAIRVKLFDFFDNEANVNTKKNFVSIVNNFKLPLDKVGESTGLEIWKIEGIDIELLRELVTFPAIKELSIFPKYEAIQPTEMHSRSSVIIPFPESKEYPSAGLLDTGVPENHSLSPWVLESTNFVRPDMSNRSHGCSVGALLIMAHYLNPLDIDEDFLKIVNVEILGNTDEDSGKIDVVYEDEFIWRMEKYFRNSNSFPRIWNMSLGFADLCDFRKFSDLAVFLDKLQDKHDLIFALPSGNYNKNQFRTWPPETEDIGVEHINEDFDVPPDYLTKPADCVRAITVGAIACDKKTTSIVGKDQPASYSRKGPGPSFIPKPEVVHYSGNISISEDGKPDCRGEGIKSLDNNGFVIDRAGTSFAAPMVSRTLAFLEYYMESRPSSLLLKALLIHHARMLKSFRNFDKSFYYVGFGLPMKANNILFCSPYEITLIFEDKIRQGIELVYPFYWPNSLRNQERGITGEAIATLISRPPLHEAFGAEYVRADVRFSLQSKNQRSLGEENWISILPEAPNRDGLKKCYESNLIKEAFKWSPVKRYYHKFRGRKAEELRISIKLFLRDGPDINNLGNIDFALILTLRDPEEKALIYNEVTSRLRSHGIVTEGIELRGRLKEKIG